MAFVKVSNFGNDTVTDIIGANIVSFIDWGLLDIGAYTNITNGTTDGFGIDYSVMKPIEIEGMTFGSVWQTQRMNWVWETGMSVNTPNSITGVTVNGTFYASDTTGTYEHYYNYPLGCVVFSSAIPTTSVVSINHSYKIVKVERSTSDEMLDRVQLGTIGKSTNFNADKKDDYNNHGKTRIQLPWIGVEMVSRQNVKGVELGNTLEYNDLSVLFHVLSEDDTMINRLVDIIKNQHRSRIYLYDTNLVATSNAHPLDYRGMPITGAKTYPELTAKTGDNGFRIDSYLGSSMKLMDINSNQPIQNLNDNLLYKPFRMGVEVIF